MVLKQLFLYVLKVSIKLFLLFLSVSCITSLPALVYLNDEAGYFYKDFGFFPLQYAQTVQQTFIHLFTFYHSTFNSGGTEYELLPYISERYRYTMVILFSALLLALLMSFLISFVFLFLSKRTKRLFKHCLVVLDSIPDVIIILGSQLLVITLYQATGFKLLKLYGIGGNVYFLPILCLSFVPIVMIIKIMIQIFEEEMEEPYVEFAFAKGLSRTAVIAKHVIRNVLRSLFTHIGIIYLYMLSSLYIIESLFQMQGFMPLLATVYDSRLSSVAIILILIPFGLMKAVSFKLLRRNVLHD